jgi:flagellar export protein FliJ
MFRFRFAKLMEVKEKLLESKQEELKRAISASGALARGIHVVEEESARRCEAMVNRCMAGEQFSLLMGHLAYLDRRKAAMVEEKKREDGQVETLRKELSGLAAELKMYEKLKLKDLQAARMAERRKEQKVMDGLAGRGVESSSG